MYLKWLFLIDFLETIIREKSLSWTTKIKMTGLKVRAQRKGQQLKNTSCLVANAAQCMTIHASLFCAVLVGFVNLRY